MQKECDLLYMYKYTNKLISLYLSTIFSSVIIKKMSILQQNVSPILEFSLSIMKEKNIPRFPVNF